MSEYEMAKDIMQLDLRLSRIEAMIAAEEEDTKKKGGK